MFRPMSRWFIAFVMLTNFLISAEYSITRPASNSLFLALFSAKALPWVWLMTLPLNFGLVGLYNRYLGRFGPLRMWLAVSCGIVVVNGVTGLLLPTAPWLIFLQFAWKDIYILLMFKQLWSLIHSTIQPGKAKYLYGFIFGMGTVGSILGGLVPGLCAVKIGSAHLFFLTLPLYAVAFVFYRKPFSTAPCQSNRSPFPKNRSAPCLNLRSWSLCSCSSSSCKSLSASWNFSSTAPSNTKSPTPIFAPNTWVGCCRS